LHVPVMTIHQSTASLALSANFITMLA